MKKLVLAVLLAALAGGASANPGFGGMNGGGRGGGFHGNVGVHAFHGFGGFPVHHGFAPHRSFVFIGAAVPPLVYYGYPAVGYMDGQSLYLYCPNPSGYYPAIQYCPTGWLQVVQ